MQQAEKRLISPEKYFEMEEAAEYKNEYYHGEIFAMSGASFHHNLIAGNVLASLHNSLRNTDCVVFISRMKIQVDEARHYTYPDVSIVCGDIEFAEGRDDTVTNPVVIFEVLSESTRSYDKGDKFTAYRKISSLRDYILVDQYACHAEYFHINEADRWELDEFESLDDVFTIRSVGVQISLNAVYDRIELSAPKMPG